MPEYSRRSQCQGELHSYPVENLYEVLFSVGNNGGQLAEASLCIIDKQTEKELPIFVCESELKEFWNDLSIGIELTETSKWTREENRLP